MARSRKSSSSRLKSCGAYAALMRGINVGGKNKLSMSELAKCFSDVGCTEVRTYIQSGNVVFHAGSGAANGIPHAVSEKVGERFGFRPPVVLRTAVELARVVAKNPFVRAGVVPDSLHVVFLAGLPDRRRIADLDQARSLGDSFEVQGREIYLHLPNGVARTRLTTAYFDSTLATTSTVRNWRTVLKLLEMAET